MLGSVVKYGSSFVKGKTAPKRGGSAIMNFIKDYWLWILGIILLFPHLVAYMRKQERKDKVRATDEEIALLEIINKNPQTQKKELNKITTNGQIHQDAKDVFHHLGYAYAWYDPRSWSENDKEVFNILSKYSFIPDSLIESYFLISSGRNLYADCQKLLPTSYFNALNW